jgi:hypothetical protein
MRAITFPSLVLALLACGTFAAPSPSTTPSSFRLDVHSHVVPDLYKEALIQAGYPVTNGTVYTSGFPVPSWDLTTHIEAMDLNQVNYSILSISAPGINFLAANGTAASELARNLNLAMYNYTQTYPTRVGAMCVLPLPHVDLALKEIEVGRHLIIMEICLLDGSISKRKLLTG